MTPGRRAPLLLGTSLVAACTRLNPAFIGDDTVAAASGDPTGTTDVPGDATTDVVEPTTGEFGDVGSASGGASSLETTGALAGTTEAPGGTTEDLPGTTGLETTDASSTGAPEPQTLEVQADAAACVLLPNLVFPFFAGPSECEFRVEQASAYADGMLVDKSFSGGNGRAARVYLRFSIPAELADATLVDAQLELHVGAFTDAGSADMGVLLTTESFLPADLAQSAPGAAPGLELPLGPASDGEALLRPIPLELLVPGQALHLGVFPASDDGGVLAGNGADEALRPKLTLTYAP